MANKTMSEYYALSTVDVTGRCSCGAPISTIESAEDLVSIIKELESDDEEYYFEFEGDQCGVCGRDTETLTFTKAELIELLEQQFNVEEAKDMLSFNWDEPMTADQCIARYISYEGEEL